jgi:pyrroloquinoline quinone (PQQ) biosynthesis protein C
MMESTYGKLDERKMKYFRSDNGLDSRDAEFLLFCKT